MKTILTAIILLLAQLNTREAAVQGRVLNSDNSPAGGMIVELLRQSNNAGTRQWHPVESGRVTTDDRGQFRMVLPGAGSYYLRIIKTPPTSAATSVNFVDWTPTTYFPGTLNAALASSFRVGAGQNLTIDVTIPQTNPYTVSGRVVNSLPGQSSLPATQLILTRRDYGAPIESSPASLEILKLSSGSDSRFEIRGVPSGSYELFGVSRLQNTASEAVNSNSSIWVARATFDISDQDIDNVSVVLRSGFDVTGKLTVVGDPSGIHLIQSTGRGGGVVGTQVHISLNANDGSPVKDLLPRIEGDAFSFDNVPAGTYSISVSVAGDRRTAYVADVRSGGKSLFGENLVVGDASPVPLEVVINTSGASIPVTVAGKGAHTPLVVLVPELQYRKNPHRYPYSHTDSSGRVVLNHVPPGEYTIHAWDYPSNVPLSLLDPTLVSKYGTQGIRISITGSEVSQIEVPLVRMEGLD